LRVSLLEGAQDGAGLLERDAGGREPDAQTAGLAEADAN